MSILVGKVAPTFTAAAVMANNQIIEDFNLDTHIKGKYAVLFFWPMDFTFVCPSEIIAFSNRMEEFKARNTEVIGISVDSQYTHFAWRNTQVEKGGVGAVKFPMVADITKSISRAYDVLTGDAVALRGTFLIGRDGIVRHQLVNDLPLGRDVDEAIRVVDALQFFDQHGDVCPAGWKKGESGMKTTAEGVANYLESHASKL